MKSNWLETTVLKFKHVKIDAFSLENQLRQWQKVGNLDEIELGI